MFPCLPGKSTALRPSCLGMGNCLRRSSPEVSRGGGGRWFKSNFFVYVAKRNGEAPLCRTLRYSLVGKPAWLGEKNLFKLKPAYLVVSLRHKNCNFNVINHEIMSKPTGCNVTDLLSFSMTERFNRR